MNSTAEVTMKERKTVLWTDPEDGRRHLLKAFPEHGSFYVYSGPKPETLLCVPMMVDGSPSTEMCEVSWGRLDTEIEEQCLAALAELRPGSGIADEHARDVAELVARDMSKGWLDGVDVPEALMDANGDSIIGGYITTIEVYDTDGEVIGRSDRRRP